MDHHQVVEHSSGACGFTTGLAQGVSVSGPANGWDVHCPQWVNFLTARTPLPILPRMATKLKPLTVKLTKTQIQDQLAERTGLARKQVASVLDCLGEVIEAHLTKNAVGEFVLPGLMKISTVRKPATKERKGIDPFTKLEKVFKAKPASSAVKVRPLKGLKDMAG